MEGGGAADEACDDMEGIPAELMNLEFELDAADIEMLVAGPADDQYNDILDREVLAHLGLSAQASLRAGPTSSGGGGGGGVPLPASDLLSMLSGLGNLEGLVGAAGLAGGGADGAAGGGGGDGAAGGASAADQIASLLAGSHPSAQGADLADWLAAAEPVVSLEEGLAEVAAAGPGLDAEAPQPAGGLLQAPAFALPTAAAPSSLARAAPSALPRAGAPLSIQQQLALMQQQQQLVAAQQAGLLPLPADYGAALQQQQGFAPGWQQQQQQQQQQPGPGMQLDSPGDSGSGSTREAGPGAPAPTPPLPIIAQEPAGAPAYSSGLFGVPAEQGDASMYDQGFSSDVGSGDYAAAVAAAGSGDYSGAVAACGGGGGGGRPSNKKFSNRQQTRISAIEAELQRLQKEMASVKLENQRLKAKNQEVEQQLRTQEQLQQLAAAVSVTAVAGTGTAGPAGGVPALRRPLLGVAAATSPPNSQRKLLMHLTVSARPADAEMLKVAALTWPRLHDWYCAQHARFRDVLAAAAPGGGIEAEHAAKEAMRVGRYWDHLVLISRPDLSVRMLNEDMSAPPAAAPPPPGTPAPPAAAGWPAAALAAAALPPAQRASLATTWRQHCDAAAQRAQRKQELLAQIRSGFLQPLQNAKPEDVELGKPLARRGLEAMEALRLVVRQDHVASVQVACGMRKLLTPTQWARLVVAAWPFYPDPSKWAPLLVAEAAGGGA